MLAVTWLDYWRAWSPVVLAVLLIVLAWRTARRREWWLFGLTLLAGALLIASFIVRFTGK